MPRSTRSFVWFVAFTFLLVILVHAAKIVDEGTGPIKDPAFVVATLISIVGAGWALWLLLRRPSRSS